MRDSPLFIEFVVSRSRQNEDNAYRRLLWAILVDLLYIRDLPAHSTRIKKQKARDLEWIRSPSDAPFSFIWICQCLGLDPEWVRCAYLGRKLLLPTRYRLPRAA